MPMGQAVMVALSGFAVVFLMLCILWGLIEFTSKAVAGLKKEPEAPAFPAKTEAVPEETPVVTEKKPMGPFGGEIALYDVDEKTAACIMAIVSDSTKIPLDHLIFKSIRALD